MPLLFSIHATPSPEGFGKPSVPAVAPQGITGLYDEATDSVVVPDLAALREALPYRWRKAFDRAAPGFWYDKTPGARMTADRLKGAPPHMTLYRYRRGPTLGPTLATIYAIPYRFEPQA
jgi:hypothetical protein